MDVFHVCNENSFFLIRIFIHERQGITRAKAADFFAKLISLSLITRRYIAITKKSAGNACCEFLPDD